MEGRGAEGGRQEENMKENKSKAAILMQQRAWKMSFHFLAEHSGSSACVMTGKKNDLLTSIPPLTLGPSLRRRSEHGRVNFNPAGSGGNAVER